MMSIEKSKKLIVGQRLRVWQGVDLSQYIVTGLETAARQLADHPRTGRHLTLLQGE